jgi:hypothetical protein
MEKAYSRLALLGGIYQYRRIYTLYGSKDHGRKYGIVLYIGFRLLPDYST